MLLFDTISEDIKRAMLARDHATLEALRGIKKEFLEAKTAKGGDGTLSDERAVQILGRMLKQRRESAELYHQAGRQDLCDEEMAQAAVIERYMPKQLSDEELTEALREIIAQVGAQGPQDLGKVMGAATRALASKADGRTINQKARQLLS